MSSLQTDAHEIQAVEPNTRPTSEKKLKKKNRINRRVSSDNRATSATSSLHNQENTLSETANIVAGQTEPSQGTTQQLYEAQDQRTLPPLSTAAPAPRIPPPPEPAENQISTSLTTENVQHFAKIAILEDALRETPECAPTAESIHYPQPQVRFFYDEKDPLPKTVQEHHTNLSTHIAKKDLQSIVSALGPISQQISHHVAKEGPNICRELGVSEHAVSDMAILGLYDIIVYCDNSTSMGLENRYEILKNVVGRIARIAGACNQDGISLRFLNYNNDANFNGIMTEREVQANLDRVGLSGATPLGTVLLNKVIRPMIVEKAKRGELKRPVLVSVITDGEPTEDDDMMKNVILACKNELRKLPTVQGGKYGKNAVTFQISAVGTSASAKAFLEKLKKDEDVGSIVFCTTEKTIDDAAREAGNNGELNTWLVQLLAGAIKR